MYEDSFGIKETASNEQLIKLMKKDFLAKTPVAQATTLTSMSI